MRLCLLIKSTKGKKLFIKVIFSYLLTRENTKENQI